MTSRGQFIGQFDAVEHCLVSHGQPRRVSFAARLWCATELDDRSRPCGHHPRRVKALGLGLMLAPFNCVQQDVDHLVRFIVRAGFFVSPVMWTWEMAVERGGAYIDLIMLNPMVFPITLARRGFEGTALGMPSQAIVFSIAWGLLTYVVGSMVFCAKERKAVKHL